MSANPPYIDVCEVNSFLCGSLLLANYFRGHFRELSVNRMSVARYVNRRAWTVAGSRPSEYALLMFDLLSGALFIHGV